MQQIRTVRVDGDVLSTPVHHYRHPESGREVDLVLTVHFGESGYYTQLRKVLDARTGTGGVVYCEDPNRLAHHPGATRQEQRLLAAMRRNDTIKRSRLHLIGWQTQHDGLAPDPSWVSSDLHPLEIMRSIGVRKLRLQQWLTRAVYGTRINDAGANKAKRELALAARVAMQPTQRRSRINKVLINQRNTAALNPLQNIHHDAALLWGALHGPGLDAGLRDLGYTLVGTDWYRVAETTHIGRLDPPTAT